MTYITASDLFGSYSIVSKKGKKSERGELLEYFHQRARNKKGEPYNIGFIAFKLSHLNIRDLYYFRSSLIDQERTRKDFNWNKAFWGSLKTEKTPVGVLS